MDVTTGSAPGADVPSDTPPRNPFVTTNGRGHDYPTEVVTAASPAPQPESAAVKPLPALPAGATAGKTLRLRWRRSARASDTTGESPAAPGTPVPDRPRRGALGQVAKVRTSLLVPRPDVFTAPTNIRGVHSTRIGDHQPAAGWFLLAAHGGAGNTLLQRLSECVATPDDQHGQPDSSAVTARNAGQWWPDPALEGTGAVVVVTRTTVAGLAKARDLGAQYLAGAAPAGITLLGVVVVADQPGKPPAPVAKSIALLDGVFARTWPVPYVPQYRLIGPDDLPPLHPLLADVLTDIHGTLADFPTTRGPSR